jgi:REP element-mobilizing transposase RayT
MAALCAYVGRRSRGPGQHLVGHRENDQCQFKMARRSAKQLDLPSCSGWGGARPRTGPRPKVGAGPSHVRRATHQARWPVHVTFRALPGLPSLRARPAFEAALVALRRARRPAFRVIHYSIQIDHVHLIVEADSSQALSRGVQGLAGRCARAVNRAWARRGSVWAHRYHARALRNPTEVRRALIYVLLNFRKHLCAGPAVDPRSSGPWFDGWSDRPASPLAPAHLSRPRTWLASSGWRRAGGLIDLDEMPIRS